MDRVHNGQGPSLLIPPERLEGYENRLHILPASVFCLDFRGTCRGVFRHAAVGVSGALRQVSWRRQEG